MKAAPRSPIVSLALAWLILSCAGNDRVLGPPPPDAIPTTLASETSVAAETFTGTAGALTGPWTQQDQPGTLGKTGSGVGKGSVNEKDLFVFWNANTFSNDQYSQVRIAGGLASGTQYVQISVRSNGTSEAAFKGYAFFTDGVAGTGHSEVDRVVNGSWFPLRSFATTFTTGDIVKMSVVGTKITLYKNGVSIGTVTDATFTTGAPGVGVYGSTVTIDDWEGGSVVTAPVPVATVTVSPATASLVVGATQQLSAMTQDASNNVLVGRAVTWASSNPAAATVDANGLVTAVATGSATITASSEGQSGTSSITVTQTVTSVASVTVTPASASVSVGGTQQLTATTSDANGNALTGRAISWSSDAPSIATVSTSGLVTAVGSGAATLTATSEGKAGSSAITVTPAPVATVTVSPSSATLVVGGTQQLSATTKDGSGATLTGRTVTWSSSSSSATVDANGLVSAISAGTATITATSEGKSGTSAITVTLVPVASVTISPASASVVAGATQQFTATTRDANNNVLTGRSITWRSSNSAIATVSSTGLVTGAAAGGPVSITATSEGQTGTASVTVTQVPVATVSVNPSSVAISVGGTQPLTATVRDASGNALTGRVVTWSSDAPSVANVNGSTGVVTGMAAGSATITATSEGRSGSASATITQSSGGAGPLHVSTRNGRYFENGAGQIVYLTGSHTWSNLQDNGTSDPPPAFNYPAYLDFLTAHGHNFFRLWVWEQTEWTDEITGNYWFSDGPFQRTGPGLALDGKPKFDLTQFNQAYFDRLRSRVQDAGARGIYVSVMLFNGWSVTNKPGYAKGNPWDGHPFNIDNNINGINPDTNDDGSGREVQTLVNSSVTALQDAYVRKVIDAVNDLDNVLFEIDNEGDVSSKAWQYHMIQLIKNYEATKPKRHPVGITAMWPNGVDADLYSSAADWVSPIGDLTNPAVANGSKVVISDTDHLCGICGNTAWVWKSFTRGQNPILMDGYDGAAIGVGASDYSAGNSVWEAIRKNFGYARNFSLRINMAAAVPRGDLSSTGYCLAVVGSEYLVFLPNGGSANVNLSGVTGARTVEWLNPGSGKTTIGASVNGGSTVRITAPFSGAAVAYIHP